MVELSIDTTVIQFLLDEVLQRVEQTCNREIRAHEASCAWFQVAGMRKIIKVSSELHTTLHGKQVADGDSEYRQVQRILDATLEKLERFIE